MFTCYPSYLETNLLLKERKREKFGQEFNPFSPADQNKYFANSIDHDETVLTRFKDGSPFQKLRDERVKHLLFPLEDMDISALFYQTLVYKLLGIIVSEYLGFFCNTEILFTSVNVFPLSL